MKNRKRPFDFIIFITVLVLLSMGIVMVFSASSPTAYHVNHDIYHILKKQLVYAVIGIAAMLVAANYNYKNLKKYSPWLLTASIVLLVLVLIPGIGKVLNDSRRWIYIGNQQFQPSEIAKLSIIMFFSYSLAKRREQLRFFFKGLMPYFVLVGIFSVLLMRQPHLSCTIIVILVSAVLLFTAGAKIRHFLIIGVPTFTVFAVVVTFVDYMRARVTSFLDPWKYAKDDGWQAIQSL